MALSNKLGALVLTTGNKSEMAVGYCTLYGDMVGALAVIGDVVKTRVYAVCRWLNREREIIPRGHPRKAALRRTATRPDGYGFACRPTKCSTPFSRPMWSATKRPNRSPNAHGFPLELVRQVVRLVERSEYKRQQAAPVLKVTSKVVWHGPPFSHRRQGPGVAGRFET